MLLKNTYKIINDEFKKREYDAIRKLEDLRNRLYVKFPDVKAVDEKISKVGIKATLTTLQFPENTETISADLQKELQELKQQKAELYRQYAIPENWEDVAYICPKCRDTGAIYDENVKTFCSCYVNRFVEVAFENSGMDRAHMGTFEKFDSSIFSDEIDEKKYGYAVSPRQYIEKVRDRVKKYVEQEFDVINGKNLLLCGSSGTGKTYLSECAASYLLEQGKTVLYISAPVMFDKIMKEKFSKDGDGEGLLDIIYNVDLLIIDDLGTESRTDAKLSELLTIINLRDSRDNNRPCKTIISTNIMPIQLAEQYDERIASRLLGNSVILQFFGPNVRMNLR